MEYLILLALILIIPRIYSALTFTEGWYDEGWWPFFKKLFTGKLKFIYR